VRLIGVSKGRRREGGGSGGKRYQRVWIMSRGREGSWGRRVENSLLDLINKK
jgi:hypothetical protein